MTENIILTRFEEDCKIPPLLGSETTRSTSESRSNPVTSKSSSMSRSN